MPYFYMTSVLSVSCLLFWNVKYLSEFFVYFVFLGRNYLYWYNLSVDITLRCELSQ